MIASSGHRLVRRMLDCRAPSLACRSAGATRRGVSGDRSACALSSPTVILVLAYTPPAHRHARAGTAAYRDGNGDVPRAGYDALAGPGGSGADVAPPVPALPGRLPGSLTATLRCVLRDEQTFIDVKTSNLGCTFGKPRQPSEARSDLSTTVKNGGRLGRRRQRIPMLLLRTFRGSGTHCRKCENYEGDPSMSMLSVPPYNDRPSVFIPSSSMSR